MKSFAKIFILTLVFEIVAAKSTKPVFYVTEAIRDVINSLYVEPKINFDVIIYKTEFRRNFDIINGIRSEFCGKLLRTSEQFNLTQSAVIFTEHANDLKEILLTTELTNSFAKPLKILIYVAEKFQFENLKIPIPNYD
jgi:hypothetical protein